TPSPASRRASQEAFVFSVSPETISFPTVRMSARTTRSILGPGDLHPGASLVAFEHAPQLRPSREDKEHIPHSMRDVERETAADLKHERGPRVREERIPLPDVHEDAEAEAEDEADARKRPTAPQGLREQAADNSAEAPGEHLPWRPHALAEEKVRGERREGA